jgi:hypothetical protein
LLLGFLLTLELGVSQRRLLEHIRRAVEGMEMPMGVETRCESSRRWPAPHPRAVDLQ